MSPPLRAVEPRSPNCIIDALVLRPVRFQSARPRSGCTLQRRFRDRRQPPNQCRGMRRACLCISTEVEAPAELLTYFGIRATSRLQMLVEADPPDVVRNQFPQTITCLPSARARSARPSLTSAVFPGPSDPPSLDLVSTGEPVTVPRTRSRKSPSSLTRRLVVLAATSAGGRCVCSANTFTLAHGVRPLAPFVCRRLEQFVEHRRESRADPSRGVALPRPHDFYTACRVLVAATVDLSDLAPPRRPSLAVEHKADAMLGALRGRSARRLATGVLPRRP